MVYTDKYFDDNHASAESQLENLPVFIGDSDDVKMYASDDTYDGMLKFADALSYQLRYREAIEVYNKLLDIKNDDYDVRRKRAARFINTLQIDRALEDFLTLHNMGGDVMDLSYRIGLCRYMKGEYASAKEEFERSFEFSDDEMKIANIYWHTLASWRNGEEATMQKYYQDGMDVGHHTGYETLVMLAAQRANLADILDYLQIENADVEFTVVGYGTGVYVDRYWEQKVAEGLFRQVLERNEFWITYAYIACYNDRRNGTIFRPPLDHTEMI